jgi:epoxyqueuosine reductase
MNKEDKLYNEIKEYSLEQGASLFGVADVSSKKEHIHIYPEEILDKMDRAICLGYHLSDAVLETIVDRPNKLYYRHYKMANIYLDQLALKVGEKIQRMGYDYIPIPASQMLNWDIMNSNVAHASHRAVGVHAGLGWRGRNSLLVNPHFGSRVRYVTLLTDMPLKADEPIEQQDCGACRACIDACPAGAITEEGFDVDKCHELLKHFGKTLHVSLICGVCLKACRGKKSG